MIRLIGKFKHGVGNFSRRPIEPFRNATGEQLQNGTINVDVGQPFRFREHFHVPESQVPPVFGWQGDYRFEICRVEGAWGYRIKGGHPPNIVEVMSASEIKKDGRELRDGDELLLEFFE
jgi:hypothetical protein